jgi:hypothetical protein
VESLKGIPCVCRLAFSLAFLTRTQTRIPDILEKSYDEKADAKTSPITLWGVKIDPSNLMDARVSVVLLKFLRAR